MTSPITSTNAKPIEKQTAPSIEKPSQKRQSKIVNTLVFAPSADTSSKKSFFTRVFTTIWAWIVSHILCWCVKASSKATPPSASPTKPDESAKTDNEKNGYLPSSSTVGKAASAQTANSSTVNGSGSSVNAPFIATRDPNPTNANPLDVNSSDSLPAARAHKRTRFERSFGAFNQMKTNYSQVAPMSPMNSPHAPPKKRARHDAGELSANNDGQEQGVQTNDVKSAARSNKRTRFERSFGAFNQMNAGYSHLAPVSPMTMSSPHAPPKKRVKIEEDVNNSEERTGSGQRSSSEPPLTRKKSVRFDASVADNEKEKEKSASSIQPDEKEPPSGTGKHRRLSGQSLSLKHAQPVQNAQLKQNVFPAISIEIIEKPKGSESSKTPTNKKANATAFVGAQKMVLPEQAKKDRGLIAVATFATAFNPPLLSQGELDKNTTTITIDQNGMRIPLTFCKERAEEVYQALKKDPDHLYYFTSYYFDPSTPAICIKDPDEYLVFLNKVCKLPSQDVYSLLEDFYLKNQISLTVYNKACTHLSCLIIESQIEGTLKVSDLEKWKQRQNPGTPKGGSSFVPTTPKTPQSTTPSDKKESKGTASNTPTTPKTSSSSSAAVSSSSATVKDSMAKESKGETEKQKFPRQLPYQVTIVKGHKNAQKAIQEHLNELNEKPKISDEERQKRIATFATVKQGVPPLENLLNPPKLESPLTFKVNEAESMGAPFRPSMEDAHFVLDMPSGIFAGVLDGHGDQDPKSNNPLAQYAKAEFPKRFPDELKKANGNVHQAFERLIYDIDQEMLSKKVWDAFGCTATLCYIDKNTGLCFVATVGDSEVSNHITIDGKIKTIAFSCLRNWKHPKEAKRAAEALGDKEVEQIYRSASEPKRIGFPGKDLTTRLWGSINLSRSMGDARFKRWLAALSGITFEAVIVKPKISMQLVPRGSLIVIRCDGVPDYVPEYEVNEILETVPFEKQAEAIVAKAYSKFSYEGGGDNVTVLLIKVE